MGTQNARALVGRAVVSVADGEKLGAVSDVLLDVEGRTVRGFTVSAGDVGWLHREQPAVVPLEHIRTIGPQAITVENKDGITVMDAPFADAPMLDSIRTRVVTAGGEVIGDGDDLAFDDTNGAIVALHLAPQGGFLGIGATTHTIPVAEIVGFGRDVITVQDAALARVRPPE